MAGTDHCKSTPANALAKQHPEITLLISINKESVRVNQSGKNNHNHLHGYVADIQIIKERSVLLGAFVTRESSSHSYATGGYFVGVLPIRW
jgi:hypothetical protein